MAFLNVTGLLPVLLKATTEAAAATFGKIGFRFVMERLFSRLIIVSVTKLVAMDTNFMTPEDGEAILNKLKGKSLPVFEGKV